MHYWCHKRSRSALPMKDIELLKLYHWCPWNILHIRCLNLYTLTGANPESLYKDDYGQKTLMDRVDSGTVCDKCLLKFNEFLEFAGTIYEEMCEQVCHTWHRTLLTNRYRSILQTPINIVRGRKCSSGLLPLCMDGGGMRGLVSVVCLLFASRRILGDETLINYFDWLIGTRWASIGAVLYSQEN